MAKRVFTFAKLHKDGVEAALCDDWTAHFQAVLEPLKYPNDTEPYLTVAMRATVKHRGKAKAVVHSGELIVFSNAIPIKCRETLLRLLWEADDVASDQPGMARLYYRLKEQGKWPPPRSEWIMKKGE
ncbi:MAG: hypothetical protein MUC50_19230 [Myxococcota bacterium]|jgi:hypothetical protein|nr:hypothetical protein [Myxococcota bacterium]